MDDLHVIEAQHQVHIVLVGAGLARDKRWIAIERDPGERDRSFVLRTGNDRLYLTRERGFNRRASESQRSAAARGAIGTEVEGGQVRPRAVEHVETLPRPVAILRSRDDAQIGGNAAGFGMPLKHAGIADEQRPAGLAHGGIERSFEADLRSDARRIADGNGNSRLFAHAWTPVLYIGCTARTREGVDSSIPAVPARRIGAKLRNVSRAQRSTSHKRV